MIQSGYKRIRAGVPIGWVVADKTGSGGIMVLPMILASCGHQHVDLLY